MARWWRAQKGELAKDAIIGFVVGVVLFLGACWWDAKLQARQDELASTIANRQDGLARDLANQAEVLENTRFVRQLATSDGGAPKPFASINLHGAELGGLNLECADTTHHRGCADFSQADLGEANLRSTRLGGADFIEADLHQATLDMAEFSGAILYSANLNGVTTGTSASAEFSRAQMHMVTLVGAQLDHNNFARADFTSGNADNAALSWADFHRADLRGSSFKHADLRHARFSRANMAHVDLTSADLRGANFTRADLRKAIFTDICFDATTKWGSNTPQRVPPANRAGHTLSGSWPSSAADAPGIPYTRTLRRTPH